MQTLAVVEMMGASIPFLKGVSEYRVVFLKLFMGDAGAVHVAMTEHGVLMANVRSGCVFAHTALGADMIYRALDFWWKKSYSRCLMR